MFCALGGENTLDVRYKYINLSSFVLNAGVLRSSATFVLPWEAYFSDTVQCHSRLGFIGLVLAAGKLLHSLSLGSIVGSFCKQNLDVVL